MANSNSSIDMFVVGTNGLSTAGPQVSINLHDLIDLLEQHEERAVLKYIKMKEDAAEASAQRSLAETNHTLQSIVTKIEKNIKAENNERAYDAQCVLQKIISEIEDLETMNQFSLKIDDVFNGNKNLVELFLPKLLSLSSPLSSTSTPDAVIEKLYRDTIKEMQETTIMYREWKRNIDKKNKKQN